MTSGPMSTSPTHLLHLPDEILLRIIDYLIPRHTICPESAAHRPRHAAIGQTCLRLFRLVRKRLLVLDFVHPRSVNDVTQIPNTLSRRIELYTRLASPYAEVLRLPTDFCPRDPALTSLGWCPHLRELCVTMNDDPDQIDMEQYFIGHKKLEVLTLHTPGKDVLAALAYASLKIRQLNLVTLNCSGKMVKTLDNLLSNMTTLESLTISLHPGRKKRHYPPRLQRHLALDPNDPPYLLEQFMFSFAAVLRKNSAKLAALRRVSLWAGSRSESLSVTENEILTESIANAVRRFAFYVDTAREFAFDNPPDLKLHKLRLRMFDKGEPTIDGFMRGLIDSSTEVMIHLYHITVSYPRIVDRNNPPRPVIKELRLDFSYATDCPEDHLSSSAGGVDPFPERFSSLPECAEFQLESLVIHHMEITERFVGRQNQTILSKYLRCNKLKAVKFQYRTHKKIDLKNLIEVLQLIASFAPLVREIALPLDIVIMTEAVTTEDLMCLQCADSVRILTLCTESDSMRGHKDFRPYEDLFIPRTGRGIEKKDLGEWIVVRLPEFLEKIRQAFPNLTHLCVEPTYTKNLIDENLFPWIEQIIKGYEQESGVDASSLRTELKTWVGKLEESDESDESNWS